MTITTKAQLDSTPKTVFDTVAQVGHNVQSGYLCTQLNASATVFGATVPSPAAAGSGGTLWSNGSTGFPRYPDTDTSISGVTVGGTPSVTTVIKPLLYDLVWGCSGIVGNSTLAQNIVGFPTLTRPDANGTNLELFIFVRTIVTTAVSTTITVSYTNTANTAGRSASLRFGATLQLGTAGLLLPFLLQQGDTGVKSVQSVTIGTAQTGAGDLWLILGRRLCQASGGLLRSRRSDAYMLGLPPIGGQAALCLVGPVSNVSATVPISLELAHG